MVLADDDPSMRRLVALALEDLPVELVACADAAAARRALRQAPAVLLLTDLMMPGESGLSLLAALAADPAMRGPAQLGVFSAGIDAPTRVRLHELGVCHVLLKPVAIEALLGCVTEAIAAASPAAAARPAAAPGPAPGPGPDGGVAAAVPASKAADDPIQAAIDAHFAGDEVLFHAFRASCIGQFGADIVDGDTALAGGDLPALRRLAHSLKSVLHTLGHPQAAAQARRLEEAAADGRAADATAGWPALREALRSFGLK